MIFDHRSVPVCSCVRTHVDAAVGLLDHADGLGAIANRMLVNGSECEALRIMTDLGKLRIEAMREIRAAQNGLHPPPCSAGATALPLPEAQLELPLAAA